MAKFTLSSIEGGEEKVNENGQRTVSLGVSAPAIVDLARRGYRSGDEEWAKDLISSGWPTLPYLAVMKAVKGDYKVEGTDVIIDIPEIPEPVVEV